jgi:hypothetical protein
MENVCNMTPKIYHPGQVLCPKYSFLKVHISITTLLLSTVLCVLILTGCSPSVEERKRIVESTNDQAVLTKMVIEDSDEDIRLAAIEKISDQVFLSKIATNDYSIKLREVAIKKLTEQAVLYRVACEDKELSLRILAIGRMTDQQLLSRLASEPPAAAIRLAAVALVTNDDFLLSRSRLDISDAVRTAAVDAIKQETYLVRVIIENDIEAQREAARRRVNDPMLLKQINVADQQRAAKLASIKNQTNNDKLAEVALHGEFDLLRLEAARQLNQQEALGKVSSETKDREVCKIVFGKLTDQKVLLVVSANSSDNAVRIAASIKSGQTTWENVFDKASAKGAGLVAIGEALAAVDLFPEQAGAKEGVVQACLNFIKQGDETRIPELADLLDLYGDVSLTEDYLNCGQPDLDVAGRKWAGNHGYDVGSGNGSNRATWGSNK